MYFNLCFYFFDWYCYKNYESCNWVDICAITAGNKNYKSIIKIKKRKHDEIVLLEKSKQSRLKVFISKSLIDSNRGHDEFFFNK